MMSALHRMALLLSAASLCFLLDSCTSSPSIRGVPRNLPAINLHGSAATPPHGMDKKDYPFDANGQYVTSWAALGGAPAGASDYKSWRSSHGGSGGSRNKSSSVKKYTASSKKGSSSKKSGSSSKSKSKSGGGGGSSGYVVKSGDTLSAIARRNNTSVAKLKAANGLSSDMIRAGKPLKIPK